LAVDLYNALAEPNYRNRYTIEKERDSSFSPGREATFSKKSSIEHAIAKVSQAAGVHPATTKRMLNIEQHGSPKLKAQVMAGEVGIQTADREITARGV